MSSDQIDRKALQERIEAELAETEKRIEELEEQTKPISPENSIGRISRMDAINNKSIADAQLTKERSKLKNLKVALEKVDNTDFGICIKCKNPIPEGRLLLMPHALKCVNCAN